MKLLTFLGTGDYKETSYCWQDKEYTTKYAPIAACHFLQPEEVVIFLTKEARAAVFDDFVKSLPTQARVNPVEVPLGRTESELWSIFDAVCSQVNPKEEVAFDVTHGFRSSPFISLLAAAFLRSAFDVQVRAVLYGAYKAPDQREHGEPRTPVFDLTPLFTLLEWAVAADRFNRTGDSRYLASLIDQQRKKLALSAKDKRDPVFKDTALLDSLSKNLTAVSQNLQLIRPLDAMYSANALAESIEEAIPVLNRTLGMLPFNALLDSVKNAYLRLSCPVGDEATMVREILETELRMIGWYIDRELWMQAASLEREWVISWVMVKLGKNEIRNRETREFFENLLGGEAGLFIRSSDKDQYIPLFLGSVPEIKTVLKYWHSIADMRNDLMHAGHRERTLDTHSLTQQIKKLYDILSKLPV